ncbi:MAG: ATP:cob(I)alamin adenosyltransferase, partial [Acidimicrobiales bacterium]
MTIYTKKGDDGTTGLLYGGRVAKDAAAPTAYGEVDEAQAFLGVVRAQADRELAGIVLGLQRDLWVVMAELATDIGNVAKLTEGQSRATEAMVEA